MAWRPIATAPKTGKPVLVGVVWATVPIINLAWWNDGQTWDLTGCSSQEEARGWWFSTSSCGSQKMIVEPTHWQPCDDLPPEVPLP